MQRVIFYVIWLWCGRHGKIIFHSLNQIHFIEAHRLPPNHTLFHGLNVERILCIEEGAQAHKTNISIIPFPISFSVSTFQKGHPPCIRIRIWLSAYNMHKLNDSPVWMQFSSYTIYCAHLNNLHFAYFDLRRRSGVYAVSVARQ